MKVCPECGGVVQLIGEWSFCLDCDWDDLPELADKKGAILFKDKHTICLPGFGMLFGVSLADLDRFFPSISGEYLDRLGAFVECYREENESDEAYRGRILVERMGGRR